MKRQPILCAVVTSALFVASACSSSTPPAPSASTAPAPSAADGQWLMQNKDATASRYSALSEITAANVKNLKVAWSFSTGVLRGHEGEPLVVGNTMYVHTPFPNHVYALDRVRKAPPSSGSTRRDRTRPSSRSPAATRSTAGWPTTTARSS
jgi:glucose dehydrogenase